MNAPRAASTVHGHARTTRGLGALDSTYVLDSTYGLGSSYGGRWSGTQTKVQSAAATLRVGQPVWKMRPAVNMCLQIALEDYAWVNSCCRSGTAVFTGSVAVTRPFVSDVSLTLHITRELDELKQSTATTS